jgi:DNA-binding NarL/FixJ family response regulator
VDERLPAVVITQFGDHVRERDAVELIVAARKAYTSVKCIVVCDCDQRQIEKAFAAGATAVLRRTAPAADFLTALRQVFEQSIFFARPQDALPVNVVQEYLAGARSPKPLTKRELQTLRLVAQGHSNAAVAAQLWVTEQTVKFHLSNAYRKLNVSGRLEAIHWAQTNGLLADLERDVQKDREPDTPDDASGRTPAAGRDEGQDQPQVFTALVDAARGVRNGR